MVFYPSRGFGRELRTFHVTNESHGYVTKSLLFGQTVQNKLSDGKGCCMVGACSMQSRDEMQMKLSF